MITHTHTLTRPTTPPISHIGAAIVSSRQPTARPVASYAYICDCARDHGVIIFTGEVEFLLERES